MDLRTKNIIRIIIYSSVYAFTVFAWIVKYFTIYSELAAIIAIAMPVILFLCIAIYSYKTLKEGVTNSLDLIYFFKHSILLVLIPLGVFLINVFTEEHSQSGDAAVAQGVTLILFIPVFLLLFGLYWYLSHLYKKKTEEFISKYNIEPINVFTKVVKLVILVIIALITLEIIKGNIF